MQNIFTKILTVFNSLSPIEVTPAAWAEIETKSDKALSKLADKATIAEVDQNLVLHVIDLVHKVAINSATASISHKHPHVVRLLNENPTNRDYLAQVQDYFKETSNTPEALDTVTFALLDTIQKFYPALKTSFNQYAQTFRPDPIHNSRLADKQEFKQQRKLKQLGRGV